VLFDVIVGFDPREYEATHETAKPINP
jgi:hypothetical protein